MADRQNERTSFGQLISDGALEIGDGYRARHEELGGDGLIFLRAGHVTDTHIDFEGVERFHNELESRVRSKISQVGDAVVTTKGNSTGRTTFVTALMPPFVYSPHLSYWRSKDPNRVEGGFLRYWSKSREFLEQLAGMKASTDMAPYLSLIDQKRLRISLPPIHEQRRIAHILGTLDDRIELNRRMSETLEAMARALFKSWFVDFDPVRAKMAGRDPGLPKDIANLFPDRLVESELGEIPEGWECDSVLKQAELLSGGTPKTDVDDYWGGDIPWASAKDVSQCADAFLVRTERLITKRGLDESSTQLIPAFSTVVVARGATTGRLTMFGDEMAMNQTCYGLRSRCGSPFALYCAARAFIDRLVHAAHGSVFDTITTKTFQSTKVVLPPECIQLAFDRRVKPFFARILTGLRESESLVALRDGLLPKLVSGEIRTTP